MKAPSAQIHWRSSEVNGERVHGSSSRSDQNVMIGCGYSERVVEGGNDAGQARRKFSWLFYGLRNLHVSMRFTSEANIRLSCSACVSDGNVRAKKTVRGFFCEGTALKVTGCFRQARK